MWHPENYKNQDFTDLYFIQEHYFKDPHKKLKT